MWPAGKQAVGGMAGRAMAKHATAMEAKGAMDGEPVVAQTSAQGDANPHLRSTHSTPTAVLHTLGLTTQPASQRQ